MSTLRIHRGFAAAEADWRAAEAHLVHFGFARFDWLASWQETLGAAAGVSPCIVVALDAEGRAEFILPLGVQRWRGMRALVCLGGPVSDYRGPLLRRDFDAAGFAALWARIRAALPPHDVVRFDRVPETIEGVPNPLVTLDGARATERAWSSPLPATMDAYHATLRRTFVTDTARRRRKLCALGPVAFETASDPAAMAEALAVMKAQKTRRWLETGNPDHFAEPAFAAFYDLATRRLPDAVHGSILRVGATPVAAHWGMVHAGRYYDLMIGSCAGEWLPFSVGRLLVEELVRYAIGRQLRVFDMTVGDEGYKRDWVDDILPLWTIRQAASPAGRAWLAAEAAWQGLRARAKRSDWLRRVVRRVRRTP